MIAVPKGTKIATITRVARGHKPSMSAIQLMYESSEAHIVSSTEDLDRLERAAQGRGYYYRLFGNSSPSDPRICFHIHEQFAVWQACKRLREIIERTVAA